jgi:hypothetical protein
VGVRDISAPALALATAGAATVWIAHKGVSLGSGFRTLLTGQPLPEGEDLSTTVTEGRNLGAGELPVNNEIAAMALGYVGQGIYQWGGGGRGRRWDCSGFVNYGLCHDLGMAIPGYGGGAFDGSAHGPVTGQWAIWSGCTTIPRDQVTAGDLVIWPLFHMGIAIDNATMVAAPGPNGTPAPVRGRIDGAASGPLVCRRLLGRR